MILYYSSNEKKKKVFKVWKRHFNQFYHHGCIVFLTSVLDRMNGFSFLVRSRNFRRKYIEITWWRKGCRKIVHTNNKKNKKKSVSPIYFWFFGVWFRMSGLNCVLGRSSVFVFVWKVVWFFSSSDMVQTEVVGALGLCDRALVGM